MVPIRYIICVLCTIVGMVTFLTRSNINIAIVSMIEPDRNASTGSTDLCPELRTGGSGGADNETAPSYGEVFDWSPEMQGTLLGCFFWTYCTFQAPSGYVNGRYGGRFPVSLSLLISAIITALGPIFAHVSVTLLVISRMVMGVFQSAIFPGLFVIAVTWVPIQERAMAMAMTEIGSSVGTIFLYFTSGFLVQKFTWTSMFYMPATASFLVFVVFILFIRNNPEDHPFITDKEVAYIKGKIDETSTTDFEMESANGQPPDNVSIESYESEKELVTEQYSIPWRKMLTNKAVVSLCLFKFSRTLVFHFINSKIPYYLKVVMNEDIVSVGITYAIFTVIQMVMVLTSAKVSEIMIDKGWLSRTNCRRLFSLFSGSASAIAFMLLVACRCNQVAVKCLFYFIAFCQGCGMASDVVMPPELTTHFSAIVYALGNMSQVIPGFVSPMFAGFVLGRYGEEWIAWDIIFNTIGVFGIVCNIIFLIFIRAEKQDFDNVKEPPPRDHRTMSVVSALSGHMPY